VFKKKGRRICFLKIPVTYHERNMRVSGFGVENKHKSHTSIKRPTSSPRTATERQCDLEQASHCL
jgi:hypothetical protein